MQSRAPRGGPLGARESASSLAMVRTAQLHQTTELLRGGAARGGDTQAKEVNAVRDFITLGILAVPPQLVVPGGQAAKDVRVDRSAAGREDVQLDVRVLTPQQHEREVRA